MNYLVEFYDIEGDRVMRCDRASAQDALLEVAANYNDEFWNATCYYNGVVVWKFERKLRKVG